MAHADLNISDKLAVRFGSADLEAMLDRQNLNGAVHRLRRCGDGEIGCLGGSELPEQGNVLFFTGVPINAPAASRYVDAASAKTLFAQCDGAFVGVFWDAAEQVLVIATDCLGMQPLYLRHTDDELIVVSETKALSGPPDLAAWGAFISLGHPVGDRCLMEGLKRASPASILTYDSKRGSLTIERYWDWPPASDAWRHYDFLSALEADVRGYADYGIDAKLLLSGGFDSRLLLFVLKRAGLPVDALAVAHDDEHGNADGRLAARIARHAGVNFQSVRPPPDFFSSSAYLDYLVASDVGFPSHGLFIAKVASQIDAEALWDGLAPGFLFMPLHQPAGGFDAYLREEVNGWESGIWRATRQLFKPEIAAAMYEGFAQDIQSEFANLPRDGTGLTKFVIENRSRNRAAMNPLKVYANRSLAFTPGLSRELISHAVTIPFEEKKGGRFYRRLFARCDRRALSEPFLSGGELMPARRRTLTYYRERLKLEYYRSLRRHPRLLELASARSAAVDARSEFLSERLFEHDSWLSRGAFEKLRRDPDKHAAAWRLLFHWKAWQWVHSGRLNTVLNKKN